MTRKKAEAKPKDPKEVYIYFECSKCSTEVATTLIKNRMEWYIDTLRLRRFTATCTNCQTPHSLYQIEELIKDKKDENKRI